MALLATPAPRTRALAPRSICPDRRTDRQLVTVFVLVRMLLLVLSRTASVKHVHAGRRGVLVLGRDDDLAAFLAPEKAVSRRSDTASTTVLPEKEIVEDQMGPPVMPAQAAEVGLRGVRRAGANSVMETTVTTLVVAGSIGLLGVAAAAAFLVHSITGPVRRAVRVLQPPAEGRLDQRLRLSTRDELPDMSPPSADTVSAGVEQVPNVPAVTADVGEIALDVGTATVTATSAPAASSVGTTRYAAARGRAVGPTTALWHAVQIDRLVGVIEGACETTVCGSLVRMSTELSWPAAARDVCPTCATLAH